MISKRHDYLNCLRDASDNATKKMPLIMMFDRFILFQIEIIIVVEDLTV